MKNPHQMFVLETLALLHSRPDESECNKGSWWGNRKSTELILYIEQDATTYVTSQVILKLLIE